MKFEDIPGLQAIKAKLVRTAREGKIAHAQLFMGREGVLNLPLALAYTTFLHCTNRGERDACGTCPACAKSLKYIHPDTHFVFPLSNVRGDKDVDRFRADIMKSWRKFLLDQPFGNAADWTSSYGGEDKDAIISKDASREIISALSLKPFESPFKVMIIWLPEYMRDPSANGILKILEEPPANTFFLLVSNNPERLLPTILSRTQQVTVPLLDDNDLDQFLATRPGMDIDKRKKITTEAEGNLHLALELMESDVEDHHEQMAGWLRVCYKRDYPNMITLAEEFHKIDKLQQHALLSYTLIMLRETLLAMAGASTLLRSRNGEQKFVHDFSRVMTLQAIEKAHQLVTEAGYHLERNGSAKMTFLDLSLQLSKAMNQ